MDLSPRSDLARRHLPAQERPAYCPRRHAGNLILQLPPEEIAQYKGPTEGGLERGLTSIGDLVAPLERARMCRSDSLLVRREFAGAAHVLRYRAKRGIWALRKVRGKKASEVKDSLPTEAEALTAKFTEIWHARNRPGGFRESASQMRRMAQDYSL